MTTVEQIISQLQQLPTEDLEQIEAAIEAHKRRIRIQRAVEAARRNTPPRELKAGTMDVDKLMAAIASIREGLSDDEIDELIAAMNGD